MTNQLTFVTNWEQAVLSVGINLLNNLLAFLPNLLGAVIVFALGWIIAGWLKTLTIKLLAALKLSAMVSNTPISKFLTEAGLTTKVEQIVGQVIRILTLLVFFVAAVNLLGLSTVSMVLTSILNYIPNVIAAILILVLGTAVAGIVESVVKGSLGAVDIKMSRFLGKTSSYIVMVFTILAALSQLRIAEQFINTLFIGFVAMLALGFGLSIGLGSKDIVSQVLEEWYERFKKDTR